MPSNYPLAHKSEGRFEFFSFLHNFELSPNCVDLATTANPSQYHQTWEDSCATNQPTLPSPIWYVLSAREAYANHESMNLCLDRITRASELFRHIPSRSFS